MKSANENSKSLTLLDRSVKLFSQPAYLSWFRDTSLWSITERRRRFTAAHEIAHCVLGHTGRKTLSSGDERAAERFAADLLAPLVVLHKCGVRTSGEIARICGISRQAAEIRLEQLAEREKYGFSPSCDEFEVAERFSDYIRRYR